MDGGAEDDLKQDLKQDDDHQDGGAEDNYFKGDFARTWGPGGIEHRIDIL